MCVFINIFRLVNCHGHFFWDAMFFCPLYYKYRYVVLFTVLPSVPRFHYACIIFESPLWILHPWTYNHADLAKCIRGYPYLSQCPPHFSVHIWLLWHQDYLGVISNVFVRWCMLIYSLVQWMCEDRWASIKPNTKFMLIPISLPR